MNYKACLVLYARIRTPVSHSEESTQKPGFLHRKFIPITKYGMYRPNKDVVKSIEFDNNSKDKAWY